MKFLVMTDSGEFRAMEENKIYDTYGKHVNGHPAYMVKGSTVYRYERKKHGYVEHHTHELPADASAELAGYAAMDNDNIEVFFHPEQAVQMVADCYEGEEASHYLESLEAARAELGR